MGKYLASARDATTLPEKFTETIKEQKTAARSFKESPGEEKSQ